MSQTSYAYNIGAPYAGLLSEQGYPNYIRSFTAASALVPGTLVKASGTAGEAVTALTANTDKVVGIVVHRHAVNLTGQGSFATRQGYSSGERVDILLKGCIWVFAEEAITMADAATANKLLVRVAAHDSDDDADDIVGGIAVTADSSKTMVAPAGAINLLAPVAAAGVALVEWDAKTAYQSYLLAGMYSALGHTHT